MTVCFWCFFYHIKFLCVSVVNIKEFKWDVIVVGGGASGLMAAGRAAELGAQVLLLEKMGRVGIKLALTGKGRCNLTNGGELQDFIESYRHNGKFLYNVFSRFFNEDLITFFQARGLATVEERGRRIFPASQRSQDVVRILRDFISSHGVRILIHMPVREVVVDGGRVVGVRADSRIFNGRRVILATGGASYPQTGSSGEGYRIAEKLGHSLQPIRPSLVPLEIEETFVRDLQGLALKNVTVTLRSGGQKVGEEFGEMIFTHFWVSGPIILTLSGDAVERIGRQKVELSVDFKPALSGEQVEARLIRELHAHPRKQISKVLAHLLPQRLVPIFIRRADLPANLKGSEVQSAQRKQLGRLLKDWRLTVRGPRPLEEAIVTAGGVSVNEIHPSTMESKKVKGLYFCGEMIDVDGKTGGFNLQAAFSTGWVAGEAAAKEL
jgi:predicted Rossmann fold flavoprotein